MLEYLIDNIFVEFAGRIFQQIISIPIGTNCTPLLADLFFILVWGGVCITSPQSRQETRCTTIQFHLQIYRWCIVSEKHKICRVFGIHLSTWTWNKGNNGDCSLILILGLLSLHWQNLLLGFTTNGMTSIFPLLTFHSWAVISLLHQHKVFTFHRKSVMLEPVQIIRTSSSRKHTYIMLTPLNPTFI